MRVKGFVWESVYVQGWHVKDDRCGWKVKPVPFCTLDEHVATPEGLEIHKHPWHIRHHRRAIVSGAGVYQMSLRVFLLRTRSVNIQITPAGESAPFTVNPNTVQAFERFKWAAHGKVRPSVRWKTGTRPQRYRKLKALAELRHAAGQVDRQAVGLTGACPYIPAKTRETRLANKFFSDLERLEDQLRQIAPTTKKVPYGDWPREINGKVYMSDGIDYDYVDDLAHNCFVASQPEEMPEMFSIWRAGGRNDLITYALITNNGAALRAIMRAMKREAATRSIKVVGQIKALEAAAYRAHLTRRVKPIPKLHRVRRPLYARPRPPSAPLAPPVL